jgi:hypothetical protein
MLDEPKEFSSDVCGIRKSQLEDPESFVFIAGQAAKL